MIRTWRPLLISLILSICLMPITNARPSENIFNPLFPEVPKEWHKITKQMPHEKDAMFLIYLNKNNDPMVTIYEAINKNQIVGHIASENEEIIKENNQTFYFDAWVNHPKGGILQWSNDKIYFYMMSHELDKSEMMKLAKSIN